MHIYNEINRFLNRIVNAMVLMYINNILRLNTIGSLSLSLSHTNTYTQSYICSLVGKYICIYIYISIKHKSILLNQLLNGLQKHTPTYYHYMVVHMIHLVSNNDRINKCMFVYFVEFIKLT